MTRLAVVNELSFAPQLEDAEAALVFSAFVDLVLCARRRLKGIALLSHIPLADLCIGVTYPVGKWLGAHGANRDKWRAVKALANRAPYSAALSEAEMRAFGDLERAFRGQEALGLGMAGWLETLALSAPSQALWDADHLEVVLLSLDESEADGELVVVEERLQVRHAATDAHLVTHQTWWDTVAVAPLSPEQLWQDRAVLFPRIRFLPRVEDQLRRIGADHPWFDQISRRLREIDDAASEWRTDLDATPQWKSRITGEHEGRRRLCMFEDLDGEERCFDLHARMTPGPGRIHLRCNREHGVVVVAHVGRKLGT